jgi:gamma-polyglutamate synthase
MNPKTIRTLLEEGIHPYWLKAEAKLIKPLLREYRDWFKKTEPSDKLRKAKGQSAKRQALAQTLAKFLCYRLDLELTNMAIRREQYAEFSKRYSKAFNPKEQNKHILDFAKWLGASRWQLWGDKRAFSRWFGQDAIVDRYRRLQGISERRLSFFSKRLGYLAAIVLSEEGREVELWQLLQLEKVIKPLLHYTGDSRVRLEAFRCLAKTLKQLPAEIQQDSVSQDTLQYIYRTCVDYQQDVWLQCEAIQLLESLSPQTLQVVLQKRFNEPGDSDDLFVRRRAVELLGRNLQKLPKPLEIIKSIAKDTSPYVRQELAKTLVAAPVDTVQTYLHQLAHQDEEASVRAAALLEILSLLPRRELNEFLLQVLIDSLANETDNFVLRVALKVATDICQVLDDVLADDWTFKLEDKTIARHWQEALLKQIEELHCSADKPTPIRRWAAQAAERLWCEMEPQAQAVRTQLQDKLQTLKPEQRRRLKKRDLVIKSPRLQKAKRPLGGSRDKSLFKKLALLNPFQKPVRADDATLARVLSVMCQEDYGYDVVQNESSKTIIRGHLFGFRLWRLIHEFRYPDPSKRQAFRHTTGRHFPGELRIPSGILSELAETKVPGEPLFIGPEGGWRPYLPLVDEMLDCLRCQKVQIYTSEGITTVKAPRFPWRRLLARFSLTWRYADYAHLRNWNEQSQSPASTYIEALQRLGFKIEYQPHTYPSLPEFKADPAVQRFFPLMIPFGDLSDLKEIWLRIQEYFFSVYQNDLQDLSIFAAAALGYFFFKHLHANLLLNRTRANIPLIVGGWGTRGKSGTERIKAAMFNALGYSIFSKTTGCEAMFLHASPFDVTHEMFLFRPYDKATIWEQYNVLRQADKMDMDIFLWECMGLTPAYVEILQRQWTRDDISTITNTYPDHEDLQGPAGINIPQVMTNFIPRNAFLVSTEEQMLPILQTAADEFNTPLRPVNWLQAGLLTPDVLQRFPYEEHPYNIALVMAVGDELGIEADFAVKEMADRVVLDLGVLKTYPVAPIKTRRLEFVMGMSANERFGALGNWSRMGFRDQDFEKEPGIWLSTIVNNRADRIARSRVFASLLVEDVSADQHVLIGTNLSGMVGYIRETWESYAPKQTLWQTPASPSPTAETSQEAPLSKEETSEQASLSTEGISEHGPLTQLQAAARAYRIPVTEEQMLTRLRIILEAQGELPNLEDLLNLWQQPKKLYESLPDTVDADNAKQILERLEIDVKNYEAYQALAAKVEKASDSQRDELDNAYRQVLWQWFESKLVVIHNPYTSGNQIVQRISASTPPGFLNRIMGMQNIKGTGLDFVYRWQAWEACHKAGEQLKNNNLRIAEQGLNALASFKEYGPLSEEYVRKTIAQVQETPTGQLAQFQTNFTLILSNLQQAMNEINAAGGDKDSQTGGVFQKVIEYAEKFLDAGDAIKRRKKADQVYKDMVTRRISNQTAASEVKKLNKRQKGGWLSI